MVPCPAVVITAHPTLRGSGRLEQPQYGPARMYAARMHAAHWKILRADGVMTPLFCED
jgi:hypothetical protein